MLKQQIRFRYICYVSKSLLLHSEEAVKVFPEAFLSDRYTKIVMNLPLPVSTAVVYYVVFLRKSFVFFYLFHRLKEEDTREL